MDREHFDALAKLLASHGSRRLMLRGLSALPFLGGLLAVLDPDEVGAKGRKRHKKGHQHDQRQHDVAAARKRKKKKHRKKKRCTPQAKTTTCAGNCGSVTNNCHQTVDCGPCDCDPPCGTCETCTSSLTCEPCEPCCNDGCCQEAKAICHAATGACCVPDSLAQTCNGQCGDMVDNCGVSVDCGPCTCGGCPECHVCDEQTGECIADPNQTGHRCGEMGQVCQANGACICEAGSCPACTTCENDGFCALCDVCCRGACVDTQSDMHHCGGCNTDCATLSHVTAPACNAGVCTFTCEDGWGDCDAAAASGCETPLGTNSNCAACGDACAGEETCGGGGTPGVCGCTPTTCAAEGATCGSIPNNCGGTLTCGTCDADNCLTCGPDNTCVPAPENALCDFGNCCGGICISTRLDPGNCGACGHSCFDVGGCACDDGICCQCRSGQGANCSAELPCCGRHICRTSGPFNGTCCAPSGAVTCYTDSPGYCCNTCVAFDSNCTGHCPGRCS